MIQGALDFLIAQQNTDGSFAELGRVIHKDMQGESGTGVALTAYVAIVLCELLETHASLRPNLVAAVSFIVKNADTSDVYTMALSAYALDLAMSSKKTIFINAFNAMAKESSTELYWEKAVKVDRNLWWYNQPRSVDVEMTAYGALLYLRNPSLAGKSLKIVKWLISKRNPQGGFSSTQDTVMAIEALSKFALLTSSANTNLNINLVPTWGAVINTVINQGNAMVVQRYPLNADVRSLYVNVTGTGFAVVQLVCNFYLVDEEKLPSFNIAVDYEGSCSDSLRMEICINYIPDSVSATSNMVLVVVNLPSGFVNDDSTTISNTRVKVGTNKKECFKVNQIGPLLSRVLIVEW